jgi:hypothetical protein
MEESVTRGREPYVERAGSTTPPLIERVEREHDVDAGLRHAGL